MSVRDIWEQRYPEEVVRTSPIRHWRSSATQLIMKVAILFLFLGTATLIHSFLFLKKFTRGAQGTVSYVHPVSLSANRMWRNCNKPGRQEPKSPKLFSDPKTHWFRSFCFAVPQMTFDTSQTAKSCCWYWQRVSGLGALDSLQNICVFW